ncbi:chorismate--pyruvate lyase family protein [Kitasatospora sp. NPDC059973]|uniref:chorismate--pyruvate lyase family protein n=1 Tax=Kitasatospora sp. NPDC059973 TaxID=3347020 RepID=UPI0036A416FF
MNRSSAMADTPAAPPGPGRLGLIGRLILSCDGTVTPLVEQVVGERIVTAGLTHAPEPADEEVARLLTVPTGRVLLSRTTELVGARSGLVHVRARTLLVVEALPAPLRTDLLGGDEPIGRLLRRHRIESFREIVSSTAAVAQGGAARRYRVVIGGVPAMLIDEVFAPGCLGEPV